MRNSLPNAYQLLGVWTTNEDVAGYTIRFYYMTDFYEMNLLRVANHFKEVISMEAYPFCNRYIASNFAMPAAFIVVLISIILLPSSLLAQNYQIQNDRILAPEVSHFTGIQEPGVDAQSDLHLSIPLATVPGRNGLDFDIVAQYRSGIKVTQSASWIGLGWELDLGSITRHPLGGLDNEIQTDWSDALTSAVTSQPDAYSINLAGNSTLLISTQLTLSPPPIFPYEPAKSETTGPCAGTDYRQKNFVTSPYRPWKFCTNGSSSVQVDGYTTGCVGSPTKNDLSYFTIATEDGVRYVLKQPTLSTAILPSGGANGCPGKYQFVSTWRLVAILAKDYTGPEIPDATSNGGWVKIVYGTWNEHVQPSQETDSNAKEVDTIYGNAGQPIHAQITYPYYVETPTHFGVFKTSKRYDRDLAAFLDNTETIGLNQNYYNRKLDKLKLFKKTSYLGIPIVLQSGQSVESFGAQFMEVSFKYLQNGADSLWAYSSSRQGQLLSKLTLTEISAKGSSGASSLPLPSYKFSYYDVKDLNPNAPNPYLSWFDILQDIRGIVVFQDDFGFFDPPATSPFYSALEARGLTWSLKEITYPEGGRHFIIYESDSLSSTNYSYAEYRYEAGIPRYYNPVNNQFNRYKQGGARVKVIRKYDGFNAALPDTVVFNYHNGRHSSISDVMFNKLGSGGVPFYFSGDRGQSNVAYEWVEKKFMDQSRIRTYYRTTDGAEPQTLYKGTSLQVVVLSGNTRWNWGETVKTEHYPASGSVVKDETNYWTFKGHSGDGTPSRIATIAPSLAYYVGLQQFWTNPIYLNFTHKRLDSLVTKQYFGSQIVTSRESYLYPNGAYDDGTFPHKKTETSGEGKIRNTEYLYAHEISGTTYANIKKNNRRDPVAQTSVKDNSGNGYSSTIITWKDMSGKYLPDKEFHWRKDKTGFYSIPVFDGSTPQESNGWILTQTFDQYDQHGNLTQVKDVNGIATTITWDASGTLIDSIKTRPSALLAPLTTKYSYDPNTFRLTAITDPNGQTTEYKYDLLQRLIEVINPDKRTVTDHLYYYSRDGNGDIFLNTDPNNVLTLASTHAEHVRNHDFEKGSSGPSFWTVTNYNSGFGSWDSTTSYGGVKSLKASIPSPDVSNRVVWKATFDEPVSSKKAYRMEIFAKKLSGSSGGTVAVELKFHNTSHALIETKNITIQMSSLATTWQKFVLDFSPLASSDHLYEASIDFTANSFGTVWFDRFNFHELYATRTYADGLGRDIQTRQRLGTGSIKAATVYDFAGRVVKVTKPFESADLNFTLTAVDSANAWYAANHPVYLFSQASKTYDTGNYAYTETEYFADPLHRVRHQYSPGTVFGRGDTNYVKYRYGANTANELGVAANTVLETRVFDENDVKTEIFTDTFGNKVGVRIDSSNTNTTENTTKLATAFQYNILNNLTKIAPPKAFDTSNNTPSWTSAYCTNLTYNTLGQLTSRKTPDSGPDSMHYDKKGNLRLVKDAKGAANNYFIYYKYDNLNRKIEEGLVTNLAKFRQDKADSAAFPVGGYIMKAKFQYDSTTYAASATQRHLRGRLTAIEYVDDRWLPTVVKGYIFYSYDLNGNVEWIDQHIPTGNNTFLSTKIDYQYDALGKPTKVYYRRFFPPGASTDAFYVWYDYDGLGRLERVFSNIVEVKPTTTNAQYIYWPSGQVKRLVLGGNVQGLDYLYNSRDWLTQINHHRLVSFYDPGNDTLTTTGVNVDRFAEIIGYNKPYYIASASQFSGGFVPQFNGNISWMTLRTAGNTAPVSAYATGWVFKYDKANRLVKANWGHTLSNYVWIASPRYDLAGPTGPDSSIQYDRQGNLNKMIRWNENSAVTNMTYNYYTNTNKLNYIDGLNSNQTSGNYTYDANGNMITDVKKLATSGVIPYDYRNLPTKVPMPGGTINFGYDGKGQRVSKNNLFYVPGADGKVIAVYDDKSTLLYWNIWGLDLIGQKFWKQ